MTGEDNGHLPRNALIQQIVATEKPIVVLNAVAGMGKSVVLAQLAATFGTVVPLF